MAPGSKGVGTIVSGIPHRSTSPTIHNPPHPSEHSTNPVNPVKKTISGLNPSKSSKITPSPALDT
jgi:hypothetical protein